MKKSIIRQL